MPARTDSSWETMPARRREPRLAERFSRWPIVLVLVLYCILLTSSLIVPIVASWFGDSVTWLRTIQNTGLNIAIVGMIGVLLVPFLRLIKNASDIRNTLSDIREDVNRFNYPAATLQLRQDLTNVLAAVNTYDAPVIFLGFTDDALVKALLNALTFKHRGALYVNPGVLTPLIQAMDQEDKVPEKVYVTDCPRDSCAVFGDVNGRLTCVIFRYMPRRTIGLAGECWWSATLSPDTPYPEYLYNTYERHYMRGAATLLSGQLKARLLREVNQRRIAQNRQLIADNLPVLTRQVAYSYATSLLMHAQHSIRAVSFMSPRLWTRRIGFIYAYGQAHLRKPGVTMTKIIIHGFNKDRLEIDATAYLDFIRLQRDMNVDLRFVDESLVRQTGIARGFTIIDDQVIFSAEELQFIGNKEYLTLEDFDDAQSLLEPGFFDFRVEEVRSYKALFEGLLRIDDSILLSASVFESKIRHELL